MHKERLLLLASFLEDVDSNKFDLRSWRFDPEYADALTDSKLKDTSCGTTACAIGWACTIPVFQKAGLLFKGISPRYEGRAGWTAVAAFFEITLFEAKVLFSNDFYNVHVSTPSGVSERIEEFVLS